MGGLVRRVTACLTPATADDMAPRASLGRLRGRPVAADAHEPAQASAPGAAPRHLHKPLVGDGKRGTPLLQHEINESGYLTARAALDKPIEDAGDLRRLVEGNDTVFATRQRIQYGRGNVAPDWEASGGEGPKRATVSYQLASFYETSQGLFPPDVQAATTYTLQAGNCADHAALAVRLHALKLEGQESVNQVANSLVDHSFVELRTPDRPTVTLDAWANGPAMLAEDTAWANPLVSGHTSTQQSVDAQDGLAVWDCLRQQVEFLQSKYQRDQTSLLLKHSDGGNPQMYTHSTQLAKGLNRQPGFGDAARAGLQGHKPLQQEVLAVGVMRDAYKLNVGQAAGQAQSVLQAAKTLDTMPDELARPPIRKPQSR